MPFRATPFLPFRVADPTDLTFSQLKKKFGGGKSQKNCKSQGWRGGSAFGWQTAGLKLRFGLKIGSSKIVKTSHFREKIQIFARMGDFFIVLGWDSKPGMRSMRGVRTASRQSGNESSGSNYVRHHEVRGLRNVTKPHRTLQRKNPTFWWGFFFEMKRGLILGAFVL